MRCREFERRLNALLDARKSPDNDPSLAAHAAECDDCRRLVRGQELLLAGLSQIKAPRPGRNFAARVTAKVAPQRSSVVPYRAALLLVTSVASAAAVLMAISTFWYARQQGGQTAAWPAAAPGSMVMKRQAPRTLAIMQPGQPRPAIARAQPPAITGADWLIEAPRLPRRLRNYEEAIDELAVVLPEAALRLDEMEQIAPGIRPLRAALLIVWDTLCRTLPGARVDSPQPERERTSLWWFEQMRVA